VFKTRKGSTGAGTSSDDKGEYDGPSDTIGTPEEKGTNNEFGTRRYTGRATRTKPNFYDSLHVEEQMKKNFSKGSK